MDRSTKTYRKSRLPLYAAAWSCVGVLSVLTLGACDVPPDGRDLLDDLGRGDDPECPFESKTPMLHKATLDFASGDYEFAHSPIPVVGAPSDTRFDRWAMLGNGEDERIYYMNTNEDALHEFALAEPDPDAPPFPPQSPKFAYQRSLSLDGFPGDADLSSFAMLHDGGVERLYFLSHDRRELLQGKLDPSKNAFSYGHDGAVSRVGIEGAPEDTNWEGWGMLHDGTHYRLYSFAPGAGEDEAIYQYVWNGGAYHSHGAEALVDITNIHDRAIRDDFAMTHSGRPGSDYSFYMHADHDDVSGQPGIPFE